ncbi:MULTISPECIES: Hpt domain-containing protein [Spirulina sp. CCY15215]|uniref:Hpt domain-containing protein n=1 Tax=Spirulina sp. CCY15215 TaxID=2767591 RepID=UPI001EF2BAA5|nr:Hpt domain-containing protein [Spirulina major]
MDANQQKILGYFIEESREHLETLEHGLMDLSKVMNDPEELNELFRAAHSVKGGSAMLGYNSIQKTAHRLEDGFKILKDNDVAADHKLETLFLKVYDTLQALIEQLDSPFGLRDEDADRLITEAEPHFTELEAYLNQLMRRDVTLDVSPQVSDSETISLRTLEPQLSPEQEKFARESKELLKKMLSCFKQKATPEGRKELQRFCVRLAKLASGEKNWQKVAKASHRAIANPKFSYRTLAPIIITELKQGSDAIVLKKGEEIQVSESLKQLAGAKMPQVLIPVEPKAAAKALTHIFNKKQLSQLVEFLSMNG